MVVNGPIERPAQGEPLFDRMVEILRRDITFADEAARLRQQHRL
jgi:hypothetical protein